MKSHRDLTEPRVPATIVLTGEAVGTICESKDDQNTEYLKRCGWDCSHGNIGTAPKHNKT